LMMIVTISTAIATMRKTEGNNANRANKQTG
jgi:hypothetical protein